MTVRSILIKYAINVVYLRGVSWHDNLWYDSMNQLDKQRYIVCVMEDRFRQKRLDPDVRFSLFHYSLLTVSSQVQASKLGVLLTVNY